MMVAVVVVVRVGALAAVTLAAGGVVGGIADLAMTCAPLTALVGTMLSSADLHVVEADADGLSYLELVGEFGV